MKHIFNKIKKKSKKFLFLLPLSENKKHNILKIYIYLLNVPNLLTEKDKDKK